VTKIDLIFYDIFHNTGRLNKDFLNRFLKEAEDTGHPLFLILLKNNLISEQEAMNIISERLKIPQLDLKAIAVDKAVVDHVPFKIAHYYKFFPVKIVDRVISIAVAYPPDIKIQDEIRTQLGLDIEMVISSSNDIAESLNKYYGLASETVGKMSKGSAADMSSGDQGQQQEKLEDIEKLAEDASVIKLVNQLILEAFKKRATDIHIEPYRDSVIIRYRIDGILYDTNVPPGIHGFISAIISRIKIMSNLNIVERRLPQDGRAVVKVAEQVLDLRISTIPTPFGESVVIRILPVKMLFNLEKLGLAKRDLKIFEETILKPHGIILVTGPTGSGKTTTLYACLSRINTNDRKIITIEDPIEYEMSGITQIQVQPEIGLDFSRGLRSILRHDPDVIMVGEVRDLETAEIAIRVALTGHLVFSTLHTNDAPSGITRLIDIGLEPYLVASSVEAFIAQRLIRLICPACKYEDTEAPKELKEMIAFETGKKPSDIKIFRGKGCGNCNFTGFLGRTAIYEMLLIDNMMKELILKKSSASQIKKAAIARGMRTLRQDGWQKILAGLTTPEEVMKVTSAEEREENDLNTGGIAVGMDEEKPLEEVVINKRIYRRLKSKIDIHYKVFNAQDPHAKRLAAPEVNSVTRDISAGGLVFFAEQSFPAGAVLELRIDLPDTGEPINCLARVIRVDELEENSKYDVAVCFLDLTGGQRRSLDKYVGNSMTNE